ncbi:MAG: hypothetical protein K8R36_00915 [Planctomycetales bacterium]|nr:hypothetical protein [Planctomycetales bacterium]
MLFAFWTVCLESNTSPARQPGNWTWHRCNPLFARWRVGLVSVASLFAIAAVVSAAETYDLTSAIKPGQSQAVRTAVEVKGDLKLNSDGKEVTTVPMLVKADLQYTERFLAIKADSTVRAARRYEKGEATIQIKNTELKQTLRDERRLIVVQHKGEDGSLFSPVGPLSREELELLDAPGSSTVLATILPGKKVAIDDTWKLSNQTLARLLGLEAVSEQDIVAKLTKVEDSIAIFALDGKITGAVGGVSSEIDLHAKANFDLKKKAVTWLAMQYQEKRAIGHAQPGYDATIRVRTVAEPTPSIPELANDALSKLTLEAKPEQTLLEFQAGDLIAQCNINRLPPLPKDKPLTLATFQKSVETTLSKNGGQVSEAAQETTKDGGKLLRVTVAGTASEIPIQWFYYHLTDAQNRRASVVVTLESKLIERYPALDRELISGLLLLDTPSTKDEGKEPTPAGNSSEGATSRLNKQPSVKKK